MVDRPADVLPMAPGRPLKLDWALRVDRGLRRIPGLGIFITIALIENWWRQGQYIVLAAFVVVAIVTVAREFGVTSDRAS